MLKFHFITVVWGDAYTDLFLNVALPNQLTEGNLLSLRSSSDSVYKIFTTRKDMDKINKSKAYAKLTEILPTEIIPWEEINTERAHEMMTARHREAIKAAVAAGAILIFLAPDIVISEGSLNNLIKLAQSGKKAVMVAGIRLQKETFVPTFLKNHLSQDNVSAPIAARDLVTLALDHLHPTTQSLFWESQGFFNPWPSHLYWKIEGEGILARCFHLHPLLVNPGANDLLPTSTIDDDYIPLVCNAPDDIYLVEDSDEITVFEISSAARQIGDRTSQPQSLIYLIKWSSNFTNGLHRHNFNHKIRFQCKDRSPRWEPIEQYSDKIVSTVQSINVSSSVSYNLLVITNKIGLIIRHLKKSLTNIDYIPFNICLRILARSWRLLGKLVSSVFIKFFLKLAKKRDDLEPGTDTIDMELMLIKRLDGLLGRSPLIVKLIKVICQKIDRWEKVES